MQKLILASTSKYRRTLLERFGLPFSVSAPLTDETPFANEKPAALVERLAKAKAGAVAEQHSDAVVIGSDQVAVHGHEIVGKPGTHAKARRQLESASASQVDLLTGVAVIDCHSGAVQSQVIAVKIWFRKLDEQEIERYLVREQPYDCAGSVKIEGLGITLLERIQGDDPTAIIGLPLIETARMLRAVGINPVISV